MKRLVPRLLIIVLNLPVCFASIADDPETIDGYLTSTEYAGSYVTVEGYEELFVTGGGQNAFQ